MKATNYVYRSQRSGKNIHITNGLVSDPTQFLLKKNSFVMVSQTATEKVAITWTEKSHGAYYRALRHQIEADMKTLKPGEKRPC